MVGIGRPGIWSRRKRPRLESARCRTVRQRLQSRLQKSTRQRRHYAPAASPTRSGHPEERAAYRRDHGEYRRAAREIERMSQAWPTAKLGEVLRHRKEFLTIDALTSYRRAGRYLRVKASVVRSDIPGALIKTRTQQVSRAGEFLVAEIDAKVGGFGIVPESLDGSIVSSHYFLFVVHEAKLDRR